MLDLHHAGVDNLDISVMLDTEITMSRAQLDAFSGDHKVPLVLIDHEYIVVSREIFKGMFSVTLMIVADPNTDTHPAS